MTVTFEVASNSPITFADVTIYHNAGTTGLGLVSCNNSPTSIIYVKTWTATPYNQQFVAEITAGNGSGNSVWTTFLPKSSSSSLLAASMLTPIGFAVLALVGFAGLAIEKRPKRFWRK